MAAPLLYVIGDRGAFKYDRDWLETLDKVAQSLLKHGQSALQVRVQGSSNERRLHRMQLARRTLSSAIDAGLPVFLNGRIEQARELGYPGVHLKEKRLEKIEREHGLQLATSTHSLESIQQSEAMGAAFCVFGPVFKPNSKEALPVGLEVLREMTQATTLDVLALGGIDESRVEPCIQAGAKGVACISSVMRSKHPDKAIQKLIKAAQKA